MKASIGATFLALFCVLPLPAPGEDVSDDPKFLKATVEMLRSSLRSRDTEIKKLKRQVTEVKRLTERVAWLEGLCRKHGVDFKAAYAEAKAERLLLELYERHRQQLAYVDGEVVSVDRGGGRPKQIDEKVPGGGTGYRVTPEDCKVQQVVARDEIIVVRPGSRRLVSHESRPLGPSITIYDTRPRLEFHVKGVDTERIVDGAPFSGELVYRGTYRHGGATIQSYVGYRPPTKEQFADALAKGLTLDEDTSAYRKTLGDAKHPPKAPSSLRVSGAEAVDLLKLVKLPRDAVTGNWRMTSDGVETDGKEGARAATLGIAHLPGANFRLTVTFTLAKQETVSFGFPFRDGHAGVFLNNYGTGANVWGASKSDELVYPLGAGKKHTVELVVRDTKLTAIANGKEIFARVLGPQNAVKSDAHTAYPTGTILLKTHVYGKVVFHSATLRSLR